MPPPEEKSAGNIDPRPESPIEENFVQELSRRKSALAEFHLQHQILTKQAVSFPEPTSLLSKSELQCFVMEHVTISKRINGKETSGNAAN
jgi:hypothetical protein